MKEKYKTYAYFWVVDFDCDPAEITEILGLEPTLLYLKGDPLKNGRSRRRSSWQFHSSLPSSEAFQHAHISNLIEKLLPRVALIREVASRYAVGISCVGEYTDVNAGFHMSASLIQQCAQLGVSIDFDLYTF